jgi:2-iminobutanoate/2-iminopropanoate deaminase
VSGVDPASDDKLEPVEGAAGQAHFGIRNVRTLAEVGGMSADDIGHITVLVQDYADLPAIDKEWCEIFPDPNDRPARQIMKMGVQRRSRVQWHMLAAV